MGNVQGFMSACMEEIHENPTIFGEVSPKNNEKSVEFSVNVRKGWENGRVGKKERGELSGSRA